MDITSCIITKLGDVCKGIGVGLKKVAGVVDNTMVVTTGVATTAAAGVRNILDGDEEKKARLRKTGKIMGIVGAGILITGVALAIATREKTVEYEIEE